MNDYPDILQSVVYSFRLYRKPNSENLYSNSPIFVDKHLLYTEIIDRDNPTNGYVIVNRAKNEHYTILFKQSTLILEFNEIKKETNLFIQEFKEFIKQQNGTETTISE